MAQQTIVPPHIAQKRELLAQLVRAFNDQNFPENIDAIVRELDSARDGTSCYCCEYHQRAIHRALIMPMLGLSGDCDDENTALSQHARDALERENPDERVLTVLKCACNGCDSHMFVTNLCQNCVAKPCISSCKFGAIHSANGHSIIDNKACKKCGMCVRACPYGAIVKTIVPCENACPVKAITKDERGVAGIDADRCILCGKCMLACPFGAIQSKSQVLDVLRAIGEKKRVIALIAPALIGQFQCSAGQLHSAIKKIGFFSVYEVARGAEETTFVEAEELRERLERGDKFMTTSCCAAYNALVDKHINNLKPFVSTAGTPAFYTAELARKENGDAILVFISPCVAKYREVFANANISYAINFEELVAMFSGLDIDVQACLEEEFGYSSAKEAREFPISGGVAAAVAAAYGDDRGEVKMSIVNGLDRDAINDLKRFGETGECENGNMIEVMACPGGCLGGAMAVCPLRAAREHLKISSNESKPIAEKKNFFS